jgi:hypothetical protein
LRAMRSRDCGRRSIRNEKRGNAEFARRDRSLAVCRAGSGTGARNSGALGLILCQDRVITPF